LGSKPVIFQTLGYMYYANHKTTRAFWWLS